MVNVGCMYVCPEGVLRLIVYLGYLRYLWLILVPSDADTHNDKSIHHVNQKHSNEMKTLFCFSESLLRGKIIQSGPVSSCRSGC